MFSDLNNLPIETDFEAQLPVDAPPGPFVLCGSGFWELHEYEAERLHGPFRVSAHVEVLAPAAFPERTV